MTPISSLLILGSGAREHALAMRLALDNPSLSIHVTPGNPGMTHHPHSRKLSLHPEVSLNNNTQILKLAKTTQAQLVIVGPEIPLTHGICDLLSLHHIPCLGPTKDLARLESSKAFTKRLLRSHHIPTPNALITSDLTKALHFISHSSFPLVIKPDGLTAGKGVTICPTPQSAKDAVTLALSHDKWGPAGHTLLLEEFLQGEEFSFTLLCDGFSALPLPVCKDFKPLQNTPFSPNTGGMGAWSPPPWWQPHLSEIIMSQFAHPILHALPSPFRGFLYLGMIWTPHGPSLLEINVRPGDPELQTLLPRLPGNLLPLLLAAAHSSLHTLPPLSFSPQPTCCITLASQNYPLSPSPAQPISNLSSFNAWFSASLSVDQESTKLLADGGRCLSIVTQAPTLAEAQKNATKHAETVQFHGKTWRRDIGEEQDRET